MAFNSDFPKSLRISFKEIGEKVSRWVQKIICRFLAALNVTRDVTQLQAISKYFASLRFRITTDTNNFSCDSMYFCIQIIHNFSPIVHCRITNVLDHDSQSHQLAALSDKR